MTSEGAVITRKAAIRTPTIVRPNVVVNSKPRFNFGLNDIISGDNNNSHRSWLKFGVTRCQNSCLKDDVIGKCRFFFCDSIYC